jgi:hypothetical protein
MASDREIAAQVADMQARGRDYALVNVPGYSEWSEQKLEEDVPPALIAHLDAMSMFLLPEELDEDHLAEFEELLSDLRDTIGDGE